MVDFKTFQTLQRSTDMTIVELLAADGFFSKKEASTGGGEFAGPCPFCQEGKDRFRRGRIREMEGAGGAGTAGSQVTLSSISGRCGV